MFEFLSQFFTQLQANFKVLTRGRKILLVTVALGTILGIVLLVVWTNRINYQPLYFNLSPEDAGTVIEELKDQKIPHRLSANGRTVMVPAGKIYDLRLNLASRGIPSGGGVGFEIFDKTDLGTTEFVQKLNYQRALQGELARTINQFVEVEQARVHITLPEKTLFLEDEQKPTASVVVKLRNKGAALQEKQIRGIVYLVAGSVEGLEPEKVTVVGVDGSVLSTGATADSQMAGLTNSQQEFQREVEEGLEKRVQSMLEKVVGKGKAIVRVTASLNLKQQEKTEEIFDPESAVVRSEQRTDEKSKGSNPVAMGSPGVAVNLSEGGGVTPRVSSSDMRKTNETINYEINKIVKRTVEPVGVIQRLSVAVLLDGNYEVTKGEDGKEEYKYVPRSDEEMKKYKSIVMKAVGYNAGRGDQIEVTNAPFETVRLTEEEKKAMSREALWGTLRKAVPPLASLSLIALLILLVLRPLMKWLTRPVEEVRRIAGAPGRTAGEIEAGILPPPLGETAMGREQVAQLATTDAKQFAELLRNWVDKR